MNKKFLFIIVFLMLILSINKVSAACDNSKIARLRKIAGNINLSYSYIVNNNIADFTVTVNNLFTGMYMIDSKTGLTYYGNDSGEVIIPGYRFINSGKYTIYSSECNIKLNTKYYKMPVYNIYYGDKACKGMENYYLCQRWQEVNLSHDEFLLKIDERKAYLEELEKQNQKIEENWFDKIINFIRNYGYYIMLGIIVIGVPILSVVKKNDKYKL